MATSTFYAGNVNADLQQQQQQQQLQLSQTPPAVNGQAAKDPAAHQRTYQACIPCRRRKVRCDLGSVDNPHDPPCLRCRRESKECFFSSTRRKKKKTGQDGEAGDSEEEGVGVKLSRKRTRTSIEPDEEEAECEEPRTPGGSIGRRQPLRRPQQQKPVKYTEDDLRAGELTAAMLQATEVHGGHDALKVLYQAAQMRANSRESLEKPDFNGPSPAFLPSATSPIVGKAGSMGFAGQGNSPAAGNRLERQNTLNSRSSFAANTPADRQSYADATNAWSRFRFVREGWFSAKEAISYIQYFYKYLAPLTPVALPDFSSYESHERLLTEEPMLTITMLLISTRHMKLEGPGAVSRAYEIHKRLWNYLQGMINRVVWGQEQFGHAFSGAVPANSMAGSDANPLMRKGLRTLGTVESLVLLTEWHPRMMHFPPDEADIELMLPDEPIGTPTLGEDDDQPKGIGGQRMDAWLEPVWRSDRMCWMLLGMAMSLAFEIGVFDASDWQRHARTQDGQPLSAEDLQTYDKRRGSVRDLLLVYVTQTSGRLGLTTVLPTNYSKPEDSDLFKRGINQHANLQENIMHFWLRMAAIVREGNANIFANKAFTRDLIKNAKYEEAIKRLTDPLEQWRVDFDRCLSIPKYMRCILLIEYEYCRVYVNALALQAVAERCANEHPLNLHDNPAVEVVRAASAATTTINGMRTDTAIPSQTLARWLGRDRKYMTAVGDGARNLLKIVVDGLQPDEYLRHAPVRTYFRIISVAIILLKSFSLGASESDVADSLALMDRTVEALQTCIVDDVHVASRFAELLEKLSKSLKPRLIRITADGRASKSRRVSMPGTPMTIPAPVHEANASLQAHQAQQHQQALPGAAPTQPAQQQWTYNQLDPSGTGPTAPSTYNNNPLLGISSDAYDLAGNDYSVMPPPNYMTSPANSLPGGANSAGGGSYDPVYGTYTPGPGQNSMPEDWLTLPLDGLFGSGNNGAVVNQTMYGPQIGDQDMLELLLNGAGANGFGG